MVISAMKSAQVGLRRQMDAFDLAVSKVTSATLNEGTEPIDPVSPMSPSGNPSDQLLTAFADMLIAQRLFMAILRAARTSDEMLETTVRIGD